MKQRFSPLAHWGVWGLLVSSLLAATVQADQFDPASFEKQVLQAVEKASPAVVAVLDRRSTFSAVVVSADGYVLTAGHAVRPDQTYRVRFADGRQARARALGVNERFDCAMMKIEGNGTWPYAELGDSTRLLKYQPCLSISHPGRFDGNRGAVVRLGYIADPMNRRGFIQSTAKMEPGDSGGPLLDLQGRVIGIHSNIRTEVTRNYEVPVDIFKKYWDELKEAETFEISSWPALPQLGFQVQQNDAGNALEVTRVDKDTFADTAGIQVGDEILSVNQRRVSDTDDLRNVFRDLSASSNLKFPVRIRRTDSEQQLELDLWQGHTRPVVYQQLAGLEQEIAELENRLDDASVELESELGGKAFDVLATRISPRSGPGYLVSKNSRVGENPIVKLDGKRYPATIVRRDEANDLVLLRAQLPGNAGVVLNDLPGDMFQQPGKLLITPDPDGAGEVGVWGSKYFRSALTNESGGFLGVQLGTRDQQVVLQRVEDDLAAASAGLAAGDVLLQLNDRSVGSRSDVFDFLKQNRPYSSVKVRVRRGDQELEKHLVLGRRPETSGHAADRLPGGKSIRRDGFPWIVSHDAEVRPEKCGGPVFDLNGQFLGINIARNSRVRTYVLPKTVLQAFVAGQPMSN